ncbi:MAG: RCC1 repeat-containing protein, partial [Actinobacteria bacterium]|nr:RCC1 repeat-containing protein [Actinomycetota bacterium]
MRKALSLAAWALAALTTLGPATAQETPANPPQLEIVAADGGVRSIAGGYGHTCAVSGRGNVWCWGANQFGQLGIGTTTASLVPQRVTLGTRIRSVTAGSSFTCALSTSGRAYCWGNNYHGELGDTTRVTRTTPVEVSGLGEGVRALVAGLGHTCAINADFELLCWGNNEGWPLG